MVVRRLAIFALATWRFAAPPSPAFSPQRARRALDAVLARLPARLHDRHAARVGGRRDGTSAADRVGRLRQHPLLRVGGRGIRCRLHNACRTYGCNAMGRARASPRPDRSSGARSTHGRSTRSVPRHTRRGAGASCRSWRRKFRPCLYRCAPSGSCVTQTTHGFGGRSYWVARSRHALGPPNNGSLRSFRGKRRLLLWR